jgi:hypothetical protein
LVIDLELYPDFQSYVARLKRRWKEVKQAGWRGLHCRLRDRDPYRIELFEIDTSLWFRSGGLVLSALRPAQAPTSIVGPEPLLPLCPCIGTAIGDLRGGEP